ncbi:MAG: hypothetical protein WC464_05030 [Bdellovibrionales bacterium]
MEGWEAWDIALRCASQLRMAQFAVIGIDMNAALKIAEELGYDKTSATTLLLACECGIVSSVNQKNTEQPV